MHSDTWKSVVIKTGSLGLVTKPVCTTLNMEAWFSANVIGRDAASARVSINVLDEFNLFKMQKEFVKLRDNHRGRLRMQLHRDKVKVGIA